MAILTPSFTQTLLNDDGQALSDQIAAGFSELAHTLGACLPAGRPLSLVMTKLEEANGWAQAAIRGEPAYGRPRGSEDKS